ncbi:hypothetical protein [uncultured Mucilaginibacter sp.]|uniref:hypothetical protein n=1 Tax=uncultured Mucilaginibacter sp. TaxID=797541 RepID=UPI0025D497DD|nr:hypothetical protein [uncultured Mucilaginibacter sp.]
MFKSLSSLFFFAFIIVGCSKNQASNPLKIPVKTVPDSLKSVITILAGSVEGFADGTGNKALFNHPTGAAFDLNGNLLIADEFNNRIRKITPLGVVTTLAGNGIKVDADGPELTASFFNPISLTVDKSGNIIIVDIGKPGGGYNLRKISNTGNVTTMPVIYNGQEIHHRLSSLVIDETGNIFVWDMDANDIKKIGPSGSVSSITFPSFPLYTGIVSGFAFDTAGNLFISNANEARVFKVKTDGSIALFSTSYTKAVDGANIQVNNTSPSSIVIDKNDNLFLSDFQSIRLITKGGFATTAVINCYPGLAFYNYLQINAIDAAGSIYIPDASNNLIRKIAFLP